jgi:hypothetical protein
VHSQKKILETGLQKAKGVRPYVSVLPAETQDRGECEGDDDTNALAAVDKNVVNEDGDTEDTEDKEETVEAGGEQVSKEARPHVICSCRCRC